MFIELISNYGLFLLKTLTVVISILVILSFAINSKKSKSEGDLEVTNVNEELAGLEENIKKNILANSDFKKFIKSRKKNKKVLDKRLFILDFKGNIKASEIVSLRREISGVLLSFKKGDEVLLRLENSGGTVHEHGLAASQLKRIKDKKIPLTICVDKVAASGGYMMACVANKIISSPFAIVGSIGVLAQVPNFNKLLKSKGIALGRTQGYLAGIDDYISKPFDPDELSARVKNVINRQERLLKEAARFADIDVSKMAKQITEIKSMLTDQNPLNKENSIDIPSFTPREASVLQLVAEGLMNKEIARQLETSIRNVEKYVSRLFIKTSTSSRTELVRYALENHLVK